MSSKKPFLTGQMPQPSGRDAGLDLKDLIHKQKRWAVREQISRSHVPTVVNTPYPRAFDDIRI